jgi:hypothetical protein
LICTALSTFLTHPETALTYHLPTDHTTDVRRRQEGLVGRIHVVIFIFTSFPLNDTAAAGGTLFVSAASLAI